MVAGPRAGVAAGMGVATADLAFGAIAAAAGGAAGAALAGHEAEIRLVAATVLAAIAVHGLLALRAAAAPRAVTAGVDAPPPAPGAVVAPAAARGRTAAAHYARFLAITMANPLTIASFAAVAASLSLDGPAAAAAFAAGVGVASAAWHLVLPLAAGHAGRWITPRAQRTLAISGRIAVLAIAAHLALGA